MNRTASLLTLGLFLALALPSSLSARTWTSAGGRFTRNGELVRIDGDRVILESPGGKRFTVLVEKLSADDRDYLRRNYGQAAKGAVKKVQQHLAGLDKALRDRDAAAAREQLEQAGTAAVSDAQIAGVELARRFAGRVDRFWSGFNTAALALQVDQVITLATVQPMNDSAPPHAAVRVVERTETRFKFEREGKFYELNLADQPSLPSSLVRAIAWRALPGNREGMVLLAAFRRVDSGATDDERWEKALVDPPVTIALQSRRIAAPKRAAMTGEVAEVRELFKKDYTEATTTAQRMALAKRLFEEAEKMENDDPEGHFVLLWEAATIAARVGRFDTTIEILNSLQLRYDVDELPARKLELMVLAQRVPTSEPIRLRMLSYAFQLADEAMRADNFAAANQILETATTIANAFRDRAVKQRYKGEVTNRRTAMRRIRTQFEEVAAASKILQDQPADPVANSKVGRFLCLFKRDWDRGLVFLAQGDHPELATTAQLDRTKPTQPANQIDVGHRWWALGEDEALSKDQAALRARAVHWYQQALPVLKGRTKLAVEKRLEEFQAAGDTPDGPRRVRLTDLQPAVNGVLLRAGESLYRHQALVGGGARDDVIWAQPDRVDGIARVAYRLRRRYLTLRGSVGFDDAHRPDTSVGAILFAPAQVPGGPARGIVVPPGNAPAGGARWQPVAFSILNEKGKVLWGPVVLKMGETRDFNVAVGNVESVILVTACQGAHTLAPAVWVSPALLEK